MWYTNGGLNDATFQTGTSKPEAFLAMFCSLPIYRSILCILYISVSLVKMVDLDKNIWITNSGTLVRHMEDIFIEKIFRTMLIFWAFTIHAQETISSKDRAKYQRKYNILDFY